jgi:hypothetical protein
MILHVTMSHVDADQPITVSESEDHSFGVWGKHVSKLGPLENPPTRSLEMGVGFELQGLEHESPLYAAMVTGKQQDNIAVPFHSRTLYNLLAGVANRHWNHAQHDSF